MVDKSTLDECMHGISFPASSEEIAECATGNSCPRDVVAQIQDLGASSFRSEEDLLCQLGDTSYCF